MLYRLMSRRETIHHCGSTLSKPGPRKPRVQLGIPLNTAELVTVDRNQGQSICFFRWSVCALERHEPALLDCEFSCVWYRLCGKPRHLRNELNPRA